MNKKIAKQNRVDETRFLVYKLLFFRSAVARKEQCDSARSRVTAYNKAERHYFYGKPEFFGYRVGYELCVVKTIAVGDVNGFALFVVAFGYFID